MQLSLPSLKFISCKCIMNASLISCYPCSSLKTKLSKLSQPSSSSTDSTKDGCNHSDISQWFVKSCSELNSVCHHLLGLLKLRVTREEDLKLNISSIILLTRFLTFVFIIQDYLKITIRCFTEVTKKGS